MVAIKSLCAFLIIATVVLVTMVDAFSQTRMLELVNRERRKVGAPSLTIDSRLTRAAQSHTKSMVKTDRLSHDVDGQLGDRCRAHGYEFSTVGENLAKGFGTNEEARVVQSWMKSSGHRANILNKKFVHCGFAFEKSYWTQIFGRPLRTKKAKRNKLSKARLVEE